MIQRIRTLEVEDFRAYEGRLDPVNLDGNVVLIHGLNGSGKTSLLHAIEYAVTGRVEHLAEFRGDYPKMLSHYDRGCPTRNGRVRLVASLAEGQPDHVIERTVNAKKPTKGSDFPDEVKASYAGRSYLSQAHLFRLLTIYQESKGEKEASPIVEFIRDFLDLGRLEAVEDGLHNIGHKARLKREYPAIVRIQEELSAAKAKVDDLRAQAADAGQAIKRASSTLAEAAGAIGVKPPDGVPDSEDFDLALHERRDLARARARQLTSWAEIIGAGVDSLPSTPPKPNPEPIYETLQALARIVEAARGSLGLPEVAPGYEPPDLGSAAPESAHTALDYEYRSWRDRVERTRLALVESQAASATELKRAHADFERLTFLQAQGVQVQADLAALEDISSVAVDEAGSLREALLAILPHVHGDDCPVCNRDFSETGQGDLRGHVVSALDGLGAHTTRLQEQLDRRNDLVAKRTQVESETSTLGTKSPSERVEALRTRIAELDRAESRLDEARGSLDSLSKSVKAYSERARAVARRAEWIKERDKFTNAIRSAHSLLDPDTVLPVDGRFPDDLIASLPERAAKRASSFSRQADALDRVLDLAEAVRMQSRAAASARRALSQAEAKKEEAAATSERVGNLVKRANDVRRAAAQTTGRLIGRTFDHHLNSLVNDIFFRLARGERFQPRITSQGTIRSLTAAVNAYIDGEKVAEDIASVLSSANLNTAALSLFIALHLASSTKPRTLVLDDPVQSMDDVHATNLAALFRSLAYHPTAPRQLILAVHDKALFEYLALELGPTKEGEVLVEVRVTRESKGKVTVQSMTRSWQPDSVRFGNTAS